MDLEKIKSGEYTSRSIFNKILDKKELTEDDLEVIASILLLADKLKNVIDLCTYLGGLRYGITFVKWTADDYKEWGCADLCSVNADNFLIDKCYDLWMHCERLLDDDGNDLRYEEKK